MHLENEQWQKIPGTRKSWIYPLIRKPSVTCSNSFIISSGRQLMVIDPGAIPDHMEKIKQVLSTRLQGSDHPVMVIAGHIHVDHLYLGLADRQLQSMARIIYAAEAWGARQIEDAHEVWTGADVVGLAIPKTRIEIQLIPGEDQDRASPRILSLPGCEDISLTPLICTGNGICFKGESLLLETGDTIEFWHTPGHSPDSITIRIGDLIHVGDIPFSTNPGIAGRPGWDRDDLLTSVRNIGTYLIPGEQVICCPGHGRALDYAATRAMLGKIEQDLLTLPDIAEFNKERLNLSVWHTLDLVEEAHRMYPIIAGKLMAMQYHLEQEGIDGEGWDFCPLINFEEIDEFLEDFNNFYQEFKEGKKIPPEIVFKAVQIFERIHQSFPAQSLNQVINPSLLRRASRLTSDLLATIQGIIPEGTIRPVQIGPFFDSLGLLTDKPDQGEEEPSDEEDALVRARKIADQLYQVRILITIMPGIPDGYQVDVDPERFEDFMAGVVEYFMKIKAEAIEIKPDPGPNELTLILTPKGSALICEIPLPGATIREIAYAGGKLVRAMEPGTDDISVTLPASARAGRNGMDIRPL